MIGGGKDGAWMNVWDLKAFMKSSFFYQTFFSNIFGLDEISEI